MTLTVKLAELYVAGNGWVLLSKQGKVFVVKSRIYEDREVVDAKRETESKVQAFAWFSVRCKRLTRMVQEKI